MAILLLLILVLHQFHWLATFPLDTEAKSTRVLNVVLLKNEGCKTKVEAFGANAKKKFVSLRPSAYANYIYFERIKMLMRREKVNYKIKIILNVF